MQGEKGEEKKGKTTNREGGEKKKKSQKERKRKLREERALKKAACVEQESLDEQIEVLFGDLQEKLDDQVKQETRD